MEVCFSDKMDTPIPMGDKLPCFFCLRDSRKTYSSFESYFWGSVETSFGEFSLRNLYRFLKLLQHEEEEKNLKDLKMPICERCCKLTEEFNKLYNLLEETKLRLDWCVQKMKVVMEKAELSLKGKFGGIPEDDDNMIMIMRADTINRISSITQLPRVAVHKIKREHDFSFPSQILNGKVKRKRTKKTKEDLNLKIIDTIGNAMDMTMPFPVRPPPSSLLSQNLHDFKITGQEDGGCTPCPTETSPDNELGIKVECDVEITEPQDELNITITDENPILGCHIKLEDGISIPFQEDLPLSSSPQYDTQELGLLKSNPAYMSNFAPITPSNQDTVRCLLCSKALSRNKAHAHWNYYCLKGMRRPIISKKRSDHSSKCSYCPFVCSGGIAGMGSSMSKHQVRFHPEHYFPEERAKAALLNLKQFQKVLVDFLFPDFILVDEGNSMSCSLCRKEFRGSHNRKDNRVVVQKHLIFKHKTELKERLNTILEDPFLEEGLQINSQDQEQPIPMATQEMEEEISPPNDMEIDFEDTTEKDKDELEENTESPSKCSYCPYVCGATGASAIEKTLSKHNMRFHPEHFFPEEWGRIQGTGYRLERFQEILKDKLFPGLLTQSQGGQVVTCSICNKKYTGKCGTLVMMQKHLIHKHKSKVKKRLSQILQDVPMNKMDSSSVNVNRYYPTEKQKRGRKTRKVFRTNCVFPIPNLISGLSASCPYCRFKCGAARGPAIRDSMEKHLVRYHPAHFFIGEEGAEFDKRNNDELRRILHDEIFPKIVLNAESHGHTSCSLCGLKYKGHQLSNNLIMMKKHVLLQHKSQVKEQVRMHLGLTSTEKVRESSETSFQDPSSASSSLKSSVGLNSENEERKRYGFMTHFIPVFSDKTRVHCKLCLKSLSRKNASMHWKHNCPNGLQRPLTSLQGNSDPSKCPYCPFECSGIIRGMSTTMGRHLVRFHPEHHFPMEKEKALEKGFKLEQFQRILTKILFPEFISYLGGFTSCKLCETKYKSKFGSRVNAEKHAIFSHNIEVKDRLKVLLEDPTLEQRLRKFKKKVKHARTTPTTLKKLPQPSLNSSTSKAKGSKYSSNCPYCPFKCIANKNGVRRNSVVAHFIRFHPEHFLLEKGDEMSGFEKDRIRRILTGVVFPKFVLISGYHTSCSVCGMKYSKSDHFSNNTVMAKRHVLFQHKVEVKEEIKLCMEDPSLEEILQNSEPEPQTQTTSTVDKPVRIKTTKKIKRKKAPPGTQYSSHCPYCRFKCGSSRNSSRRDSLVKHHARFHPEHFLFNEGEGEKASKSEREEYREILMDIIFPKLISSKGRYPSCTLCGGKWKSQTVHNNILLAKKHLLLVHKREVKKQLKIVLDESGDKETTEIPETATVATKKRVHVQPTQKKKLSNPVQVARLSNCPYCRFKCGSGNPSRTSMVRHLARFHPEHFLKDNENDDSNEIPGFGHPQFQRILTEIVFPEFIKIRGGHHTKCSLCEKKFAGAKLYENTIFARKHVMYRHKTEIKERLSIVMEDPKLGERLESCNVDGVTCSCGIYFPHSEVSTQTYHEKFHCASVNTPNSSEKVNCTEAGGTAEAAAEEEECMMEVSEINDNSQDFNVSDDVDPLG